MWRTNPNKKKRRSASKTVLMYCEGLAEETFLKHLRGIYAFNSNVAVTVRRGKGGTADGIVTQAYRVQGGFDRKIVVLDNDKSKREMEQARKLGEEKNIQLFENTPCLEALLLSILSGGRSFSDKTSAWCKREFESKHVESKRRGDLSSYEKLFPKEVLNNMRRRVSELNSLIQIIEGKP